MKVCDRCLSRDVAIWAKVGDTTKDGVELTRWDLCKSCLKDFRAWITAGKPKEEELKEGEKK